jgi:hypothetical protein
MPTTLAFAPTKDDLSAAYFDLPAQLAIPDMPNNPWPDPVEPLSPEPAPRED